MIDQLDLFATSFCDFEEDKKVKEESRFPQKTKLTPRQWALYRLVYFNSMTLHRKTTQREIYDSLGSEYGYEWNDDPTSHDHCSAIWKDVTDNNQSFEHDHIIISNDFEYWIGSKRETEAFLRKLWRDISGRLSRYWDYVKLLGYDGQGRLYDKNLNPLGSGSNLFHDCFNSYDIEMQIAEKEDSDENGTKN